jgi:hypothetical protein
MVGNLRAQRQSLWYQHIVFKYIWYINLGPELEPLIVGCILTMTCASKRFEAAASARSKNVEGERRMSASAAVLEDAASAE